MFVDFGFVCGFLDKVASMVRHPRVRNAKAGEWWLSSVNWDPEWCNRWDQSAQLAMEKVCIVFDSFHLYEDFFLIG